MQRFLRLPSPAMTVAFLALFLVLSGSAVALKGHNKVLSDDIKNGQVKTADIRNNDVRGKDVRSNTLTGSDVAESKLGKVPSAANADTAASATSAASAANATNAGHANTASSATSADNANQVNGQAPETFDFEVVPDDPAETFESGGVELSATCTSGATSIETRNTSGQDAAIEAQWLGDPGPLVHGLLSDEDFTSGDADEIANGASGAGTVVVSIAGRGVTTIDYAFQNAGRTGDNCHYWGRVMSG